MTCTRIAKSDNHVKRLVKFQDQPIIPHLVQDLHLAVSQLHHPLLAPFILLTQVSPPFIVPIMIIQSYQRYIPLSLSLQLRYLVHLPLDTLLRIRPMDINLRYTHLAPHSKVAGVPFLEAAQMSTRIVS